MTSKYAKEKLDNRMKDYKSSFNAEDFKKRRENSIISIRKQRREDNIYKRRNISSIEEEEEEEDELHGDECKLHLLPKFIEDIQQTEDVQRQLRGTVGIRKLLSVDVNPPIDLVIQSGAIPHIITLLRNSEHHRLQFEAAWVLTNIASGTTSQTLALIQNGAIGAFVEQLGSPSIQVKEQAVWALGNIAGDSTMLRDQILSNGVLEKILPLTNEDCRSSLKRNAVWAISNLCRGRPPPQFGFVSPAVPVLAKLLRSSDNQIIADACWALSYISDGDNIRVDSILNTGVCGIIIQFLGHKSPTIQTPALRIIGNIVTGDDYQSQVAIDCGVLPALKNMLDNPDIKKAVKKEVCWAISNITAGPPCHIQAAIVSRVFESLVILLERSEFEVKKEAAWAIANATSSALPEQIQYLVSIGCIKPLCDLLKYHGDTKLLCVSLEGLDNILAKGSLPAGNLYAEIVEEAGGSKSIENLQLHCSQMVYQKAIEMMDRYFGTSDDESGSDTCEQIYLQPRQNESSFQFGAISGPSNFSFEP